MVKKSVKKCNFFFKFQLPPPPEQNPGNQPAQPYLPGQTGAPSAPPPPGGPPPAYSQNGPPPPRQQGGGGYPQRQGYPQQQGGGGQNTVIIRERDRGGDGDFASGMMLGTGLGLMAGN